MKTPILPRRGALGGLLAGPLLSAVAVLPSGAMAQNASGDGLPSWREGGSRRVILDFIAAVTTEGSPDFVPVRDRIAVFDNDGTLWVEQPAYTQLLFIFDRIRVLAPKNPAWRQDPVMRAAIAGELHAVAAGGTAALLRIAGEAQAGTSPEEFQSVVGDWLSKARDAKWQRPYTDLVYQPMLEVLALMRAKGFTTFIVSGGGIEFVRAFSEDRYGVAPYQVIGSSFALKPGDTAGRVTLTRLPQVDFIDDGPGKPVGIARHIGRRPIAAFGNSDGDLQMLQYTTQGSGRRLGVIVHHDDAAREYAYDRKSSIGKLDLALDAAPRAGWQVVSMQNDWSRIFPWS